MFSSFNRYYMVAYFLIYQLILIFVDYKEHD